VKSAAFYILWLGVCLLFTLFFVGPFIWMIVTSFKVPREIVRFPPTFIPKVVTFDNYRKMWAEMEWVGMFWNSIWITAVTMALMLFFNSLAAFAFAKMRFPMKEVLFLYLVAGMIVPLQVDLIPRFHMMIRWKLMGTFVPVILLAVAQGMHIFMLRQFIRSIPDSLFDAAKIDGMGFFRSYWQIALPLAKPALITLGIFTFLFVYNAYLYPLIYLAKPEQYTIQLGLALLQARLPKQYGPIMAGSTMVAMPTLVVYLIFQRYFVRGIVMSGLKG
jgi:multiple sugar transport system permease protein